MYFRIVMLCLAFCLAPAKADVQDKLDALNILLYQSPSQALQEINDLESITSPEKLTEVEKLRLALLRCETFLQLGENEAAINIARISEAKAKVLKLEQARPYFLNCMASAFINYADFRQALPLLDSSIILSRELEQSQSLVNGLKLRGTIDTQIDSYSSAFEDLNLAGEIYADTDTQQSWLQIPLINIKIALSQLLIENLKYQQAYDVLDSSLSELNATGKAKLAATIQLAHIAQLNKLSTSNELIKQAKSLLPELETAFELAVAYTEIAKLEYRRGNNARAIQLLEISLNTFNKQQITIERLRAQRQLAEVLFSSGNQSRAMTLMEQAINSASQTAKFNELVICYQILASYFVDQGDFEQAYHYQVLKFSAAENEFNYIKDTRLLQLNTKLSRQQVSKASIDSHRPTQANFPWFNNVYLALALIIAVVLLVLALRRKTPQHHTDVESKVTPEEKVEKLINHSKAVGLPLSLILIDPVHIFHADRALLTAQLKELLREQDIVINHLGEELIVLLPNTQENGVLKIIEQIKELMNPLLHGYKASIGYAKLQQHDSLSSLIKRAEVRQLLLKNRKQSAGANNQL
ncbi:diguanylate cyclase domain-containing protein [Shewanella sp. UCD-KL12]|uniref:diguanylate cyclase domain-containing protein n=1 Tax=Shewanella sp. UCD-KL12 TaxID=1917163 RepID=UPI0009712C2C|nr:diguanylate cyclase [Shewanella sp. UCD-KL12]